MKIAKIIVLLVTITLSSVSGQALKCTHTFNKLSKEKIVSPINKDNIFPADMRDDPKYSTAKENALTQTISARKLFYQPNKIAKDFIIKTAKNVIALYDRFPKEFKDLAASSDQRQSTYVGTLQAYIPEVFEQTKEDLKKDEKTKITSLDSLKYQSLPQALIKLIPAMKNPTAVDILAFLGWMGDMGSAILDKFGRSKSSSTQSAFAEFLQNNVVNNLKEKAVILYGQYSPDSFYNDKVRKVDKRDERMNCTKNEKVAITRTTQRAGVMNLGAEADAQLKPKVALPSIGWDWQTVPIKLVEGFCINEPWAGHVSGSFYELVYMLQVFSGDFDNNGKLDANKEDEKTKKVAIAWASAFLIATGMHSSIEVSWVAKKMQNVVVEPFNISDEETKKKLKIQLCGTGVSSSTAYIKRIHDEFNNGSKKLK